jgi:hypothetical protein
MVIKRPAVRSGRPGHIVVVAPKAGYERFVPDDYKHHDKPRPKRY